MNFFKSFNTESNQIFEIDNLILKPISKNDIEQIRIWRNDQISFLRQSNTISVNEQINYFNDIIYPNFFLNKPKMILFSFFDQNSKNLLGYGGFVHIDWKNKTSEVPSSPSFVLSSVSTFPSALLVFSSTESKSISSSLKSGSCSECRVQNVTRFSYG